MVDEMIYQTRKELEEYEYARVWYLAAESLAALFSSSLTGNA